MSVTPRRVSYIVTGSRPWRMVRRTLAAGLLALVLAGCNTAPAAPMRTKPPVTTPLPPIAISRSGDGIAKTDRFPLRGDYRVEWSATYPGTSSVCVAGGFLVPAAQMLFNTTVEPGQTVTGTTHAYGLPVGIYYLDMYTSCPWTVTFTPE